MEENVLIGDGGFAKVFRQKTSGRAMKQLKHKYWDSDAMCSRFHREYEIMKELHDVEGVVQVYDFNKDEHYFTMEYAQKTLEQLLDSSLEECQKIDYILTILETMKNVHDRKILHRDISPNNILIINETIKISDFGLGKDLSAIHSHETLNTDNFGQIYYCAPEQLNCLADASKRSDVFSLAHVINYIMTRMPNNTDHLFRSVCEKGGCEDPDRRYEDAGELLNAVYSEIAECKNKNRETNMLEIIHKRKYSEDVGNWIYGLDQQSLCKHTFSTRGFLQALLRFTSSDERQAEHIIDSFTAEMKNVCGFEYDRYDNFAKIAFKVVEISEYSFPLKEKSVELLNDIAWEVNRYWVQIDLKKVSSTIDDQMLKALIRL